MTSWLQMMNGERVKETMHPQGFPGATGAPVTAGYCNDCDMVFAVEYGLWKSDNKPIVRCLNCGGHNARVQK